jgi:hypothetical protein
MERTGHVWGDRYWSEILEGKVCPRYRKTGEKEGDFGRFPAFRGVQRGKKCGHTRRGRGEAGKKAREEAIFGQTGWSGPVPNERGQPPVNRNGSASPINGTSGVITSPDPPPPPPNRTAGKTRLTPRSEVSRHPHAIPTLVHPLASYSARHV